MRSLRIILVIAPCTDTVSEEPWSERCNAKRAQIAAVLLLVATPVLAGVLQPSEAAKHIGESVTVEGVASVYVSKGGTTFVDLGGKGRSAPITGIIFGSRADKFPNVKSYDGKTVDITGTIKDYQGRPEIILDTPTQIHVQ